MAHNHDHSSLKNIKIAFLLNFAFAVAEIIGGLYINSLAIISDALHDLGDSLSLGFSWILEKISGKKRDRTFSYGYKRFSLLAALINSIVLLAGSTIIITQAIPRLFNPEHPNARGMFLFALVGITINGLAAWRLKSGRTMNERVVTWHLLEDVLGWVAVLIVSIVMMIEDIPILDPLLSIFITLYILWNVVKNLKKTVLIFLQGVPAALDVEKIEHKIAAELNLVGIHDTHIWSLDGENNILTTHLVIDKAASADKITQVKCEAKRVAKELGIQHATIEIECEGEKCELGCE